MAYELDEANRRNNELDSKNKILQDKLNITNSELNSADRVNHALRKNNTVLKADLDYAQKKNAELQNDLESEKQQRSFEIQRKNIILTHTNSLRTLEHDIDYWRIDGSKTFDAIVTFLSNEMKGDLYDNEYVGEYISDANKISQTAQKVAKQYKDAINANKDDTSFISTMQELYEKRVGIIMQDVEEITDKFNRIVESMGRLYDNARDDGEMLDAVNKIDKLCRRTQNAANAITDFCSIIRQNL